VEEAAAGDQLAISCEGVHIGKNVSEGDTLYTYMTKDEMDAWNEKSAMLNPDEQEIFEEIKKMLLKVSF
jgi:hypothetical protein